MFHTRGRLRAPLAWLLCLCMAATLVLFPVPAQRVHADVGKSSITLRLHHNMAASYPLTGANAYQSISGYATIPVEGGYYIPDPSEQYTHSRVGRILEGWYTEAACITRFFFGSEGTLRTTTTNTVNLYAKWSSLEFSPANGLDYELNADGTASLINFDGSNGGVVTVPATVTASAVGVDSATVYDVVIGANALRTCTTLKELTLPDDLSQIGGDAFCGATALERVSLPPGLESIGAGAFDGCTSLTGLVLPAGLESIGDYAFMNCKGLEELALPAKLKSIGNSAFMNCANLKLKPINPGVPAASQVVSLPQLTSLGTSAFSGCTVLASNIVLPEDTLTALGSSVFANCASLKTVQLPAGLTSIGASAFSGTGLTSIRLPDTLGEILGKAFAKTQLIDVSIPAGVKTLGASAFEGCTSLTEATFAEDSLVTALSGSTFSGCTALETVRLPAGLTTMGTDEFAGTGLSGIELPAGLTKIGNYAFGRYVSGTGNLICDKLVSIEIPASVKSIGSYAFFEATALREIVIGGAPTIATNAFKSATALERMYFLGNPPTVANANAFSEVPGEMLVYYHLSNSDAWAQDIANMSYEKRPFVVVTAVTAAPDYEGKTETIRAEVAAGRVAAPTGIARAGWHIEAWCADADLETPFDFENTEVTGDLTLYARWAEGDAPQQGKHTVTFDLNHEGAATSTKVEVAAGGKVSAPTPPTRDAHNFGGWYTDAACEAPFDFENTEVAGDLTLYAKWTEAAAGAYRLAAEWVRDSAARCLAVDSEGNVYTGGRNGITSYDAAGNERAAFNASAHYVNIGYGLPTNERIGIVRIGDKEYLAAIEPSGMGSRLYILDTDSGALFWQAQTPSAEIQSLPAVDGASGNIYAVVTETGTRWLYAFNIDAESYLWKARIGSAASSDFALFALWGDRIFFEIGHEIWGFKSDGTQLWYRNGTSPSAKFQADHSLLVNPQDGTIYWGAPNYKLQALDPDTGTTKWSVPSSTTANPVFTPDGRAILANINDRLRKIDPATGTLDEIVNGEPMGLYAAFDGDGWLYTATNIYNDSLEVVASYAQTGEAARLPGFALHVKGGAMYRLVGTVAFSVTHVEKVKPVSGADATVATLGLNAAAPVEIPLGAHVTIEALARNADGISLPGADLEWSSSDAGIAAVTAAAAGAATVEAKALGSAEIRVKAKGPELTASVAVTVTAAPVPTRMYLSYKNGMTTAGPPAIERIDGYAREAIPHIYLVVEDQYGDYYDSLPVSWEIPDLGFATYQDGSSAYAIKYGALVKAPDPTESYIKVTAQSNPNLFCQIPVSIKPQRAKTLWSFKPNPTDFSNPEWEYTSFAVNEDGSVAYLVDTGVLYALDLSTGNRLWELSLRVEGTEKPSRPKLGADGNIYLSEVGARKMYKVGPDGTLLAQSAWSAPITDFLMDGSYAYVLTAAGGINRVNDKLERLWAQDTLLAGAELYGEAELRGAYVYGENLYAASGDKLYKIHRDGACEVLFEDKNTSLRLDGVDSNGNLLLQRISATQTGLLFLNLYGKKLWSYNRSAAERHPANQPVTAIIDDTVWSAEVVFDARGDSTSDKRVYSFGADGQPSMDVVFTDSGTMPPKHIAVGPDGLIYVGTMQLNALTADGALLWQYPTDPSIAFDLYAEPTQMLSTRPGTLVVAFGGPVVSSGMIVVQAIAQDALGISLRGDALAADGALSAAAGAFSDLRLTLTDYAEAPVDATIELRLTDAATGALLSRIAYEERLVNGAAYDYALGARIPEASGDFVLYVTVTDKDQGLLCSEEIPVRLR